MNIAFAIPQFLDHLTKERQLSVHTVCAYGRDLHGFHSFWMSFSETSISAIIKDMSSRDYAARTLKRKIAALRTFFQFLNDESIIAFPLKMPSLRVSSSHSPPRSISESLMDRIFQSLDSQHPFYWRDRALLEIMYGAGLRISECANLTIQRVRLSESLIIIKGKGNKERVIPLHSTACQVLEGYLNKYRLKQSPFCPSSPLFINKSGTAYSRQMLYVIVDRYLRATHCPASITPHSLRHSFATHLMDHDAGILEVQSLLGHASIRSTQHYLSVNKNKLRQAYSTYWTPTTLTGEADGFND